jgi:alcohol dehydrogenase class IV
MADGSGMMFEFATAARIIFGPGTVKELVPAVRSMGSRALVVTGRSRERARRHLTQLDTVWHSVEGEPRIEDVREGAALARA